MRKTNTINDKKKIRKLGSYMPHSEAKKKKTFKKKKKKDPIQYTNAYIWNLERW